MKTIKINKIYNGVFPILRIADTCDMTGNYKYKNTSGCIYEIIDIPDEINKKQILSHINVSKLSKDKYIIRFSEI